MQTFHRILLFPLAALFFCAAAVAQTSPFRQLQDEYSSDQTSQVDEVRLKAQEWGLQTDDWLRYEELMQGARGIYSPGLDPLTVLGIEARSDEERRYYAELQVQAEARRVEKELAYQIAYDEAWKRLYPMLQPVTDLNERTTISGDGRLAVFVSENCPSCDQRVRQLQSQGQSFDIYLTGSRNDDAAVRRWATQAGVDAGKVRAGTVTLNHDGGRWSLMAIGGELPAVVRHVNGKWVRQ